MTTLVINRKYLLLILVTVLIPFGTQSSYGQTITASVDTPLTEATLDGSVVTLTLSGATYALSIFDIDDGVTVSGIEGVTYHWFDLDRVSDTVVTVGLQFEGNIDADALLTFTVGADAIANYNGPAVTAQVSVTAVTESVEASTVAPLTEATLDGSVVTLTLSGATYALSIFDIRDAVEVSGIDGVTIPWHDPDRESDTEITVELEFNGNFDADAILTFTVGADAIAGYSGDALTATLPVTAVTESVVASTAAPLTEATLDGSVVTLTLNGATYERFIRGGVTVSGIGGVTIGTFGVDRESDTEITVELEFNGNFDADAILTFTVGADAIAGYSGDALAATLPVTALTESVVASTAAPLTEATLNRSVITLTLNNGVYESWNPVRNNLTVSGITGVRFISSQDVVRVSDTKVTISLRFNGNIDSNGTLTFTVGADAIAGYSGDALTATLPVTAVTESVVASTAAPLTEATLNQSVITLTLNNGVYESWNPVRNNLTVSGITGVRFISSQDVVRVSDTKVTISLRFNGNIDSNGTLTFTVGADAIAGYSGDALTATLPVTAVTESVVASTAAPLTEATLNRSVITLTLNNGVYESWNPVRNNLTVSGITGVRFISSQDVVRVSDTKVTISLRFNGNIDSNATLTFTVGAGAIAGYNGNALIATLPVTALPNRAPVFTAGASTTRTVAENTGAGVNIGSAVSATDADNDTLTYTLGGIDSASFDIVSTSGQLKTEAALDYETKTSYTVTVTVSDGTLTDSITVTINVTDVINEQPATYAVGEEVATLPTGSWLPERVVDTSFSLVGGNLVVEFNNGGQLEKDGMTYTCVANGGCKIEGRTVTRGTIQATSGTGPINRAPVFTAGASTTRTVAENTVAGVNIGSAVSATDADNDTLSYTLGGIDAASFDIVRTSGQLRTSAALAYETKTSYTVTVTVSDGSLTDSITVTINVTDVTEERVSTSTPAPLTEATVDESVVTLTLTGGTYEQSIGAIRNNVTVSGIAGVTARSVRCATRE